MDTCNKYAKPFRFKHFQINHNKSVHKVGVDGTLLGAWCKIPESGYVLDIGCGSGLVSLMVAQRASNVIIDAVDIHQPSVEEADENFKNSPWSDRLNVFHENFLDFSNTHNSHISKVGINEYNLIVSNPPFYSAGIRPCSDREVARHQGILTIELLLAKSSKMLVDGGSLAVILPYVLEKDVIAESSLLNMFPSRITYVKGNEHSLVKRIMIQLEKNCRPMCVTNTLVLENIRGVPSDDYKELCKDFYIKF